MTNRRTFLTQAGLLSAGMMIGPKLVSAKNLKNPGLQLYSLRQQIPKDVPGVIAKVAAAGYKEVETFNYTKAKGYWGMDAKAFHDLLKSNGLKTPSGHYDMNKFFGSGTTEDLDAYIEAANITGQSHVIIPSINGSFIKTADDCKAIADKMTKAAEICKKGGVKLGYHNHNFEWKPLEGGGTFYDTILDNTDAKMITMEMDIYWVVRSGVDPIQLIEKHPGRFGFVHVKDMDKNKPNLNTEIGNGSIDFNKIFAKAKLGGIEHFIMEQENYTDIDPYVSITQSAKYMTTLKVS